MAEWIERKLGEVTALTTKGITPKYTDRESGNTVRVLNQKCNRNFQISYVESRIHNEAIKKVPENKYLCTGDVLINSTGIGTAGRVAQILNVPVPTTIDGHMILMRATKEIDTLYYGYAVKSFQKKIESLAEGSTGQTEINRRRLLEEIIIRFPKEKRVQKSIGTFLFQIDEKIRNNFCINNNLEQQAQAIYSRMFIEHRQESWSTGQLSDLISVKYGKDHKKLADGNYPVYGSGGIIRYVEKPLHTGESVLIPRKGTLNNVIYVNEAFWSVDTMFYTEMLHPNIAKFVYHFVKSKDLASMNAGSAVPSMTTNILNAMQLYIPDEKTLEKFENIVSPMYSTMQENTKESKILANTRDTLLPKLMSGELDVSDIDL